MTTVAVTGATGFIGRHVVRYLRSHTACRVISTGRDEARLRTLGTDFVRYDISEPQGNCFETLGNPDVLIHLAWEGLPNYGALHHLERTLPETCQFLRTMVQQGLESLTVAGTCYEYGLQSGCLSEETLPSPTTSYATAKDTVRRYLEILQTHNPFRLRWTRLFFMYGEGQNSRALIPQLDDAIASGRESFDMSGGEQLRDYLPVEQIAAMIVKVSLQQKYDGIFNVCSGTPISIRRLVEQRIQEKGATIRVNLGIYPYPEHEPMAYWGNPSRLRKALDAYESF